MKKYLCILLMVLASLIAGGAIAQNTFTLFDDGDPLWHAGVYDLGGAGRPPEAATSEGAPYSGQEYLTIWGDTERYSDEGWCRDANRVSAMIRSDVGLDMTQDWWISFDVANDLLYPDMQFSLWLLDYRPDSTSLNVASPLDWYLHVTMGFGVGDQHENENSRGGFGITANKTIGGMTGIPLGARLDPDPNMTMLRTGHNRVTCEWFAGSQTYRWTIANINGSRTVSQPASELAVQPSTVYICAGSPSISWMMSTSWTLWDISYDQGTLPSAPAFGIELTGGGTVTIGGSSASDEGKYFGTTQLVGRAIPTASAAFVRSELLTGTGWTVYGNCESRYGSGKAYSHQVMRSSWSGEPEVYSGTPAALMLQILATAQDSVSFGYVGFAGNVLTWNQSTKSWDSGANTLDITLDGGGDDTWWIGYDGTNYWLSVSNGRDVRTATVDAGVVRGGYMDCYFAAGRLWTTGWNKTADYTINSLEQLTYFVPPPLSTGPFVVELAGGATATIDGLPAPDETAYSGTSLLVAVGSDISTDAAFIKTPVIGSHPWSVTVNFESQFVDNHVFGVEIEDAAWAGQPALFGGWPGNTKMLIQAADWAASTVAVYWNESGGIYYNDIVGGVWPWRPTLLEVEFDGGGDDTISVGYDGNLYHFAVSNGTATRVGSAPGPEPVRQATSNSYVAIGDLYTDGRRSNFTINSAAMKPYFDHALFPNVGLYSPPEMTIGQAKQLPDGFHARLLSEVVSLGAPGSFYFAQEADRSSGIMIWSGQNLSPGTIRNITGHIATGDVVEAAERVFHEDSGRSQTVSSGGDPPKPLGVVGNSIGGTGVELGTGLNNLGLLVTAFGRVTYVALDETYFLMDDGSSVGDDPAGTGIKVLMPADGWWLPPAEQSYAAVTGVARPYIRPDGRLGRAVLPRTENDVRTLAGP